MLTRDEAIERLNLSSGSLELLVESRIILELKEDGAPLYPEDQFIGSGIDGTFASYLSIFRKFSIDGDRLWSWLNSSLAELSGLSPLAVLRLAEDDAELDRLRSITETIWAVEGALDPSLERTDWARQSRTAEIDADGIGDYTPTRRGGQA